ncbi:TRPM8 channel-associated factor 2-like [Phascolarctos cinereus]|uniref:TRPM8 channel-associated factor 2-like n=1 Tax=Phascolarctos cinereus TaxID=38626 RepID=A0A6P5L5J5_PHACI|nr:TRPM8 channel-associated factor 2-like [Phascolarctos cinereus]
MELSLSQDYKCLVKGLNTWELPSDLIPSELLIISEASFPVLVNKNYQVLIAASHYGQGRIVVLSHEGYLKDAKMAPFLQNAVKWLGHCEGYTVGVHTSVECLASMLCDTGIDVQNVHHFQDSLRVFCTDAFDSTYAKQLIQFVKNGGGLLIGGNAWQWAKEHGHKVLGDFPGNHVTSVAGIYFTETQADASSLKFYTKIPKTPILVKFGEEISQDQHQLLDGISKLDLSECGILSPLLVHGALAFPLGLHPNFACAVAGARYGRGRVIVLSQEGLLFSSKLFPFLINAVHWLKGDQTGRIGVIPECENLFHKLTDNGMKCSLESNLTADMSVYCCIAYDDSKAKQILEFVAEGGGLLIGGQAWSWSQQNPTKCVLTGFAGNHILNPFGISILSQGVKKGLLFDCPEPGQKSYHFRLAMANFFEEVKNKSGKFLRHWQGKLIKDYSAFLWISTRETPIYDSVHRMLMKVIKKTKLPIVNSHEPFFKYFCKSILLCLASELAYVRMDFASEIYKSGDPTSIFHSYSSAASVNKEMNLTSHSKNGSLVQIGCHSDDLTVYNKTARAPVVVYQQYLDKPYNSISSLWGGLLYIIVPHGCSLGNTSVNFTGAVPAPYFILGKTSVEEWKNSIRHYPVPWGELQAESIILTVPAEKLQHLENPEPVLHLWNEMTEAIAKLGGKTSPFPRHERIVTDVQISTGWMHSGYPIMGHLDIVDCLLSEDKIRKNGLWVPLQELGRNQQCNAWEFPHHTTDATCNIWTVYVHETVLNISRNDAHPALKPKERQKRLEEYQKNGASLSKWYGWTALETYLQLQEAFGWEPFIQVFKKYQQLSGVPGDNDSKMNVWVIKFSEQVQKNLVPFFKAWGWSVQKEVAATIAHLPEWKENPMKMYCHEN